MLIGVNGPVGVERELLLTSGADSLLNVPLYLFQALANVPSTEIEAMTVLGNSLIDSGNWWSPGATNIWGLWGHLPGEPVDHAAGNGDRTRQDVAGQPLYRGLAQSG